MDLNTMISALRNYFSAKEGDETAKAGKAVAQQVANTLPSTLMPREGLREAARRRAELDRQTAEE